MRHRTLGIHSGSFHADEVTATAFLLFYKLVDRDKIHRTRDLQKLKGYEYVCDVGGFTILRKNGLIIIKRSTKVL